MLRKLSPLLAAIAVVVIAGGVAWAANSNSVTTTNLVDVDVATAGSVTLDVSDTLAIVETHPADGWSVEVEIPSGIEVEATFRNGGERVDFNAELEDGQVRVRVRERASGSETVTFIEAGDGSTSTSVADSAATTVADSSATTVADTTVTTDGTTSTSLADDTTPTTVHDDDDTSTSTTIHDDDDDDDHSTTSTTIHDDDDDDHSTTSTTIHDDDDDESASAAFDGTYVYAVAGGSITVTIANGLISLDAVSPAAGWSYQIDKAESRRIEVEFDNGDNDAGIEVRTDNGRLEVELDD